MGGKVSMPKELDVVTDQTKAPKVKITYCGGWGYGKFSKAVRCSNFILNILGKGSNS